MKKIQISPSILSADFSNLEKDIKNLTLQFEEIIFKLDDLSNYINKIETELSSNLDELKNNNLTINTN